MEKLAFTLGLIMCIEAAAFGRFEHRPELQDYQLHKPWSVHQAVMSGGLRDSPAGEDSSPAASIEFMADAGPCGGPELTLTCAP